MEFEAISPSKRYQKATFLLQILFVFPGSEDGGGLNFGRNLDFLVFTLRKWGKD